MNRACEICGKKDFVHLFDKRTDKNYSFFICQTCSFVFVHPLPSQLEEYYNNQYSVPIWQKDKLKKKTAIILGLINKLSQKRGELLEIGASYGYFLKSAKDQGWTVRGIEISKAATQKAKENYGLEIMTGPAESKIKELRKKFDAIVMLDVLEHVQSPRGLIKAAASVTQKSGLLFITTPNIDSLEFKVAGRFWEWIIPPDHIYYFNPKTISDLLKSEGFEIISIKTCQGDAAGNSFFNVFLGIKSAIAYQIKKMLPKDKLAEIQSRRLREKINHKHEFHGALLAIKRITDVIARPSLIKQINKKKLGPELIVIAKKI